MGAADIQIAMTAFHVGIALASIYPRLPYDLPFPRSIGGDLSHPFRKILLALTLLNVIRLSTFNSRSAYFNTKDRAVYTLSLMCSATESFLRSFVCLLTPYLLQCQLQNRINIGRPGRDLMVWVYAVLLFNILGCVVVQMTGEQKYWAVKKFGDSLSFFPVYKTLRLYNTIMTQGGRYPGRGNMTSQSLMIVEYLAFVATLLSGLGYYCISPNSATSFYTSIVSPFRIVGAFANMTRVLCHGMLLNSLDEADYLHSYATRGDDAANETEVEDPVNLSHCARQNNSVTISLLNDK